MYILYGVRIIYFLCYLISYRIYHVNIVFSLWGVHLGGIHTYTQTHTYSHKQSHNYTFMSGCVIVSVRVLVYWL